MEILLKKLKLDVIDGHKFKKLLVGGKMGTVALYSKNKKDFVVKFLIAPRNDDELGRFFMEFFLLRNAYEL